MSATTLSKPSACPRQATEVSRALAPSTHCGSKTQTCKFWPFNCKTAVGSTRRPGPAPSASSGSGHFVKPALGPARRPSEPARTSRLFRRRWPARWRRRRLARGGGRRECGRPDRLGRALGRVYRFFPPRTSQSIQCNHSLPNHVDHAIIKFRIMLIVPNLI